MSDFDASDVDLRRAARERALELLYESEVKDEDVEAVVGALPLPPDPLALELVRGVAAHRREIDELLTRRVAPRWSLTRLAAVDRAVLRLAAYELLGAPDRSQAVIINEAVVLARRFGTDDSPRFVNGVLSALAGEVRPGGAVAGSEGTDLSVAVPAPEMPAVGTPGETEAAATEVAGTPAPATGAAGTTPARPQRSFDALIVDLDGVIRHWDQEALPSAERELGLPDGSIGAVAFEPDRLARAMRGELSADAWYHEIGEVVAAEHGVDASDVTAAFSSVGWRIDELVLDVLDQVRTVVPVVLLSNASSRLHDDLHLSGITDRFDVVISSADLGVVKPMTDAFAAAAAAAGTVPERCVLIDDTHENTSAAAALGMRTVLFESLDDLELALDAIGLLPSPGL